MDTERRVPRISTISTLLRLGRIIGRTYMPPSKEEDGDCDGTSMNTLSGIPSPDRRDGKSISESESTLVCSIADSPYHILRMASSGKYDEFVAIYNSDPKRLEFRDKQGMVAMHHAAASNSVNIMDFIFQHDGDINVADDCGNTPLHFAVENDHIDAIMFLIERDANTSQFNNHNMAPIHVAADLNKEQATRNLVLQPTVDVNLQGDLGQTALHFAAIKDNLEVFQILLGCPNIYPCLRDNNGVHAIHTAATHGSARVLDLVFDFYRERFKKDEALVFVDKEGNTALHSAVNSGDYGAVKLCLKYGARIDTKQVVSCKGEQATPLHLACALGALDIVKLMLSSCNDKDAALNTPDIQQQLPLHRAAMFDHSEIVDYLLEEGSYIDARDMDQRTPLLLATQRSSLRSVLLLLQKGANVTVTDSENCNILHLIVRNGGSLEILGQEFFKRSEAAFLLNQADSSGCTPMHYATKEGSIKSVQGLMDLGATVNLKNKDKQSPLHFAARYGRFNTCKQLLNSAIGPNIINESDSEGMTALHIASWFGQYRVVKLLMLRGALLHKDNKGRSPMHLAAMADYTNTMNVLQAVHYHLLNWLDDEGNTALHLAAKEGKANAVSFLLDHGADIKRNHLKQTVMDVTIETHNKDVALAIIAHERWHEAMKPCCDVTPHMLGLIQHMPEVALAVLDRCEEVHDHSAAVCQGHYYDFRYLQCSEEMQKNFNGEKAYIPLLVLNTMVKYNCVKLLSHPVCVNYLSMKWNAYGRIYHMLNIFLYLFFLIFLTLFTCNTVTWQIERNSLNESCEVVELSKITDKTELNLIHNVTQWILCAYAGLSVIKEIMQMFHQRSKYFKEATNAIEWTLYVCTLLYVCPMIALVDFSEEMMQWQMPAGAIAVFLAWFNFLLYLQRFDIFGIYVVMFLEILGTLIQVLIVFSILFIAFGLTFFILLSKESNRAHATPWMSIIRVCTALLLGELDYINSFVDPSEDCHEKTMPYPEITFIFLFFCVLLLPILLMNLLIGLAVGDIAEVQYNAGLKRLAMQVELHTELEHKLPKWILVYGEKDHLTVQPLCRQKFYMRVWNKIKETAGVESTVPNERLKGEADIHINVLYGEIMKQKRRMKEMTSHLDKQYDLLRLIVQKMEITSEADDRDEGDNTTGRRAGKLATLVKQAMAHHTVSTSKSQHSMHR